MKASKYVASKSHQGPIEDAILVMRGRKMLVHEVGRKEREKVRGVKGKDSANSGATPSVANFDDGDDDEEMGELNVEHELSDHRGLPSKVNVVDLIPFSADYGRARTHPPKNN
ncbi:hypothetical protein QJS10_CPA08g01815 [Acorus calamus]|uniref:Uncharacterized protein n=1 Tax=Acorus calamus TaxID=4465 RepID=A0AAV9EC01_ACOCL|nr:hypothetical protein QJS10_CPA08g01815 [Acorus calamus]